MPSQAPVRLRLRAAALAAGALVATLLVTAPATADEPAPTTTTTPTTTQTAGSPARATAEKALARAERLLSPPADAHSTGAAPAAPHRDATLALRDLTNARPDLSPADQPTAARLLARPTTTASIGNASILVHYNGDTDTIKAYAAQVLATAAQVHDTYLAAGYREPKPDGTLGGDARIDIYLTDLGATGTYGYCTSDQKAASGPGRFDKWAFCVLDDDYKGYPGDPTQVLQVTLAHEYFHATQFAYDANEDGWFMEGTAVWIEDYMFDDVNDNMQYVPYSLLARPSFSLDYFGQGSAPGAFRQYGAWVWFRWLSERFPESQGGLPTIIREMWEGADSVDGNAAKQYSLNAIAKVLKTRGLPLPKAFALFADANRRPASSYSEAVANGYPTAPLAGKLMLSRQANKVKSYRLDHLSSATTRFVPKRLSGGYQLRLSLDLAAKKSGSVAVVSQYLRSGRVKTKLVRLNGRGDATTKVPFSSSKTSGVEVTLVNASKRFTDCYQYAVTYACYGKPMDENVVEKVRATVVR